MLSHPATYGLIWYLPDEENENEWKPCEARWSVEESSESS